MKKIDRQVDFVSIKMQKACRLGNEQPSGGGPASLPSTQLFFISDYCMHAPDRSPQHDPNLAFATGGGVMGAVLRGFDWAATPLGPLEAWPQSLRTAVSMMLNARHPMYVAWGDALLLLYNDGYRDILGAKAADPAAVLGRPFREVWVEVWAQVAPMLDSTLRGESVWFEDHPFTLTRNGFPEEIHASFSTSPIRGESGHVTGVLCICSETTGKVRTERERDAALAALATGVEKLRIAADSAEVGMFDLHLPSGAISCDNTLRAQFDLPMEGEVSSAMLREAVHADDRDRVVRESDAVLAAPPGEDRYRMEYRTAGTGGQVRWIVTRGRLLRDAQGRPLRLIGTTLDVTRRREAEAATQAMALNALATAQANAKFHAFFEQGIHFAALMTPDGTLVEINHTAAEGCGYARAALVGLPFHEGAWWRAPGRQAEDIRVAVACAREGHVVRLELPYLVADGGERFADLSIAPVHDDEGGLLFIAANWIDSTERRKVEERLRLLDAIGEATRLATDPKTIMEYSTRLLGQYLDVTRVAYADLEPDNDRFTIRHDWCVAGALSTVGVYSLDLFGSRARSDMREGRTLVIGDVDRELTPDDGAGMFNQIGIKGIICCPLVRQGRLVAMMAVHQQAPRTWTEDEVALVEAVVDRCWAHIERVRSTEALRDADRRKSEFLATLAHELRNPLAPIRNALELLRMGSDNRALMDKVRATMERQVGHMVHLINDLLDVARISSGKVVLKIERVDLQALIASAVETSLPLIEGAQHTLTVDAPQQPLPMNVDAVRISQVLSNLLSNAAKYTPRNGRIGIDVETAQGTAVIRVSDTGIGIARESLDSVFDMFAQAPHSIGISKGGLGIGLSLVRHLVALHGGSVVATSPGPGQGSTFVVRLPLAQAGGNDTVRPATDVAGPRPSTGSRLRILVADDNVDAADTLAHLLRAKGHEVRVAYDGEEAVRVAAAFLPALAFLDIGMPRMTGYEVAAALRASPGTAGTRLVALTGWGAEEDRARSRAAGFDRHLLKPAAPEEVEAILAGSVAA
jgi:PAS domain S-box-containing protein